MNNLSDMLSTNKLMTTVYLGDLLAQTSNDYIIPEDASDTEKILTANAVVTVERTDVGEKYAEISGSICYDILLMGEDDTLYGVTYSDNFKTSITNDMINRECICITSDPSVTVVSKLINPRKISLGSEITFDLKILEPVDIQAKVDGVESLSDEAGIERSPLEITTLKRVVLEEEGLNVSHDLELDGNSPPISRILYRHMTLIPYEIKGRNDHVEIRTQANINIIYMSEEGNVFSVNKSFMVDRNAEMASAEEYEWSANVSYCDLSSEISSNSYGEMKVIEIDFMYDVDLCGSKNVSVRAFNDAYSTDYECTATSRTVSVHNIKRTHGCSLSVNSSVSREEIGASDIRNVLTASAQIVDNEISYQEEKNKLVLSGTSRVEIVCENTSLSENDRKYSSFVYTYPFKCEFDCSEHNVTDSYSTSISVSDIKYRADSTKLYCDFEAAIKLTSYSNKDSDIISEIKLNKNDVLSRVSMPFTLCYPCGKETLWDIAKYYKITKGSIIASNGLENDDITDKHVLLIPQYSKRNAVFSKVI